MKVCVQHTVLFTDARVERVCKSVMERAGVWEDVKFFIMFAPIFLFESLRENCERNIKKNLFVRL